MTFIRSHAEALKTYSPIYAGSRRVKGLELPQGRSYVVNDSGISGLVREYAFRQFGIGGRFYKRLERHNPEVVHAHFGTAAVAGLDIATALDIPLIVTFHGRDATMSIDVAKSSRRGHQLMRKKNYLIKHTSKFIAVSNYIRERLIDQGYPATKIVVLRNGIDLSLFRPEKTQVWQPIVLFVGRFVEKKGIQYLIKAAACLKSRGVEFSLVLIGDGPLEKELRQLARTLQINHQFLGFVESADVRRWLSRANVVAVPSVTAADGDSEGLPTILLEAQAMATPVVSTYHSGIPEGVIQGETAELVDERDVDGLANKIESFLLSEEKTVRFGEAARHFVTEKFDINTQVESLEQLYNSVGRKVR